MVPELKAGIFGDDLTPFKAKGFFLFIEVVAHNRVNTVVSEEEAVLCPHSSAPAPLPNLSCPRVCSAWLPVGAR